MTAAVVTADVVTVRGDSAIDVSRRVRVQDCVCNFHSTADAAAGTSRVAADGAVNDGQTRFATSDATAIGRGEVATDRAVDNGEVPRSFPSVLICVHTAAGGVATDCGVDNRYAARIVVDAGSRVIVDNAIGDC